MLNRGSDDGPVFGEGKFEVTYDEGQKATGIQVNGTQANAQIVIGDPSYFPELVQKSGKVVRAIALMTKPLEHAKDVSSYQVIFPGSTIGRQNDLYLFCCSGQHKVAPEGKYVVFVSTTVEGPIDGNESAEAVAHRELAAGLSLLAVGEPLRIFYDMYDLMKPKEDGLRNRVFISESFDATTHFETAINDVLVLYERIMGEKLNLAAPEAQEIS